MERVVALLMLAVGVAGAQLTVTGPEGDCGFSKFQPRQIAHYVERGAVAKPSPRYPPGAKDAGITGTVRVRILINRKGLVQSTCPEYVKDQPRPDRSLVIAAQAAALQWTFDPNFGFGKQPGPAFDYARGVLIFDFVLDESKKTTSKPE
jgi:TonB family protein